MSGGDPRERVGYIVRKFPVLSQTFVLNEILALEARGIHVHIFSLERPDDPRFQDDVPHLQAPIHYVPDALSARRLLQFNRRLSRVHRWRYGWTFLRAVVRARPKLLWRLLQAGYVAHEARRLGIHHLHAQFADRPTTVAFLASRLTGIPFSFAARSHDIFSDRVSSKVLVGKIKEARFVTTVSDANKEYLQEIAPGFEDRIALVYNGIDLGRFSPNGSSPPAPFRILCVARLVEKKGIPVLIKACRRLLDRRVEFRVDIVGTGDLHPHLQNVIRGMDLQSRVRLLGPRRQLEVAEHCRRSHLFVLPSIIGSNGDREGLPSAMVEALASGLPVVTTSLSGMQEVVQNGSNGVLVAPEDPDALAEALERLIRNPDVYAELQRRARSSVSERFDRERTTGQLLDLVREAMASASAERAGLRERIRKSWGDARLRVARKAARIRGPRWLRNPFSSKKPVS
jgi:glycosyltransferase involved in cell wall biosynthesis